MYRSQRSACSCGGAYSGFVVDITDAVFLLSPLAFDNVLVPAMSYSLLFVQLVSWEPSLANRHILASESGHRGTLNGNVVTSEGK